MTARKNEISAALVSTLSTELAEAWPAFEQQRFEALALGGLEERELKARITLVANALGATMPDDPAAADEVVRRVLDADGMAGWASLAVTEYVTATMITVPHVGLPLLATLTERFSAEFAIRPFIEAEPEVTFRYLHQWTSDPNEHVRRLVSEGTRPRLPWASHLTRFIDDPSPTIPLLDDLFDDESLYVRRSVANHLNDISKDHPDLAIETAGRWNERSTHGDFVARHALRSLVKRGHPAALAALGYGTSDGIEVTSLVCAPATVAIGDTLTFTFTVVASADVRAAVDYRVHYAGANSAKAPKVFKIATCDLVADEPVTITRRRSFQHVSIRRIHPGSHRIDIQVNGRVLASSDFDVTP